MNRDWGSIVPLQYSTVPIGTGRIRLTLNLARAYSAPPWSYVRAQMYSVGIGNIQEKY
jgi:hypothetical protein